MVRIGIGAATVETMSADGWVNRPVTNSRASRSTVGRQDSKAPRAKPGSNCLRIRVCSGGSDVGEMASTAAKR